MTKPFITVNTERAMSGHFATLWHWATEDFGSFWEPYESGFGRYATVEEACVEGRMWASEIGVEFREPIEKKG